MKCLTPLLLNKQQHNYRLPILAFSSICQFHVLLKKGSRFLWQSIISNCCKNTINGKKIDFVFIRDCANKPINIFLHFNFCNSWAKPLLYRTCRALITITTAITLNKSGNKLQIQGGLNSTQFWSLTATQLFNILFWP